jgi:hypothetical protein
LIRRAAMFAVALLMATPALAQSALPNPASTPGALNPEVSQATIGSTICVTRVDPDNPAAGAVTHQR